MERCPFIDASGKDHFIKKGSQNELRDEDVENIINIYRNRKTIDKYSYAAALSEITLRKYKKAIYEK